jgi:hypothetical protein
VEGEEPEDVARNIWEDRQRMKEAARELKGEIKRQNDLGEMDVVFMARLYAMRTTLLFYTSDLKTLSWREASEMAAKAGGFKPSYGRNLRHWIIAYITDRFSRESLPSTKYHLHDTNSLHDEDICSRLRLHLQALSSLHGHFKSQDVVDFFDSLEMQLYMGTSWRSVPKATAKRLLKYLGYHHGEAKKGMYIDGHERSDVVEYRVGFLARMAAHAPQMMEFDKDGVEVRPLLLEEGKKRLVLMTHDESTFYAHDQCKMTWRNDDEKAVPLAKGQGQSIMVSDFLSPDFGRLKDLQG